MKLDLAQIKQITKGAVRVEEKSGVVNFYRFTKEQEELYKDRSDDFYKKSFASAGVKLLFKTDSQNLFVKVSVEKGSSRSYFSLDVFMNGEAIGYLDNYTDVLLPEDYTKELFPLGTFSKAFELGAGEKTVCIYFPWSMKTELLEISVDDGAYIKPVKTEKKMLVFGDSISQGYDALRPSKRYAARLAETLGAEEINKAIGAEVFFPELAETKEDCSPEYITVAYGTNDWSKCTRKEFVENCRGFYTALSKNYPDAQIFAITPIWRKNYQEEKVFGLFEDVEKEIRDAVKEFDNVTVISGFDFVPKDEKYYGDLRLHPNDTGFDFYFKNLSAMVMEQLRKE